MLGAQFRVQLVNRIKKPTLIHWHGLTPPPHQDGVPIVSQPALPPGQTYEYDFPLTESGTYWMHSHQGLQEQNLLSAPLIIADPADQRPRRASRSSPRSPISVLPTPSESTRSCGRRSRKPRPRLVNR